MNSKELSEIKDLTPKYSKEEVEAFDNDDSFMDAYVELLKQSIELIYKIVWLRYCDENGSPKAINREEAVVGGDLVRLIKLNVSFLQNICEGKLEICFIINRCLAETSINVKYMLVEGEERVKRNYIKYSLITEKELLSIISNNIRANKGDPLPIEERMQNSIKRSFEQSDFDFEEVKRSSKWKSIK